jgi:two-component sensor histidine kinase
MTRVLVEMVGEALQVLNVVRACTRDLKDSPTLLIPALDALAGTLADCRATAAALCQEDERLTAARSREQARTEAQLRTEVADKEVLVREAYHRIKNNLQILSSLLELQAESTPSPEGRAALEESRHRVNAMARLHEQLYDSRASGRIRIAEYFRALADALGGSYGAQVVVTVPDPEISLDPDRAIACGLIVNELLTNACKYAFPRGERGEIGLMFRAGGPAYQLDVWDTGVGLPASVDLETSRSLGLRLVRLLAIKLQARIQIDRSPGTVFSLAFPLQPPE